MQTKLPGLVALQSSWKFTVGLILVMGVYSFNNYVAKGPWDPWSNGWIAGNASSFEAKHSGSEAPLARKLKRGFSAVESSWISHLETEGAGETLLLLLHRTS